MKNSAAMNRISLNDRILGGLWGALVGDALGVPVEFQSRGDILLDPVTGMRGHGTHNQPKGTWSDDGALTLCTVESLVHHQFSTEDMGQRFVAWYQQGLWGARGIAFDVGIATSRALGRIANGSPAEMAGGDAEASNGNGSLMRILPIALRCSALPTDVLLERVHSASSITHRHPRSQAACGLYALVIRELLAGVAPKEAFARGVEAFGTFYTRDTRWGVELGEFQLILHGNLAARSESEIDSSGYVIDTLTASLWCLLTTSNFPECVLKAVNLGDDTDTTGCVAGGLAGVAYGSQNVPTEWVKELPRQEELRNLFAQFAKLQ